MQSTDKNHLPLFLQKWNKAPIFRNELSLELDVISILWVNQLLKLWKRKVQEAWQYLVIANLASLSASTQVVSKRMFPS